MLDKLKIKALLFEKCAETIQSKIDISSADMLHAQQSANQETKSSAGDKYETGRAMSQNDRDRSAKLLSEAKQMQQLFNTLDYKNIHTNVKSGCVVITNMHHYFISAAIGNIKIENSNYYAISPISPIAQKILEEKKGFIFDFNGKNVEILDVF